MQNQKTKSKPSTPEQPTNEGLDGTPGSGFYVVNTYDRPSEEHIAQKRADGKFYYVHPRLKNVKQYWGMTPENPTPIEAFGIRIALMDGMLYGATDPSARSVTASYSDGSPRKWQGAKSFEFRFQNVQGMARRDSGPPQQ